MLYAVILVTSCAKENTETYIRDVVNEWYVAVGAKNMLPALPNLSDTGTVHFLVLSDSSLVFEFTIKNISNNDRITGVQLRAGDPVTNGSIVLDLTPTSKFQGTVGANTYGYGAAANLRQTLMDSILNTSTQFYIQLTSQQHPLGYIRGQLNERVVFAADVNLSGAESVPQVTTSASGTTWLRLTNTRKLYSRVGVVNNEPSDVLRTATIQRAAAGQNGPVVLTLVASVTEFNRSRMIMLSEAANGILINDSRLYINVTTALYPGGKIRGQLRN